MLCHDSISSDVDLQKEGFRKYTNILSYWKPESNSLFASKADSDV